MNHEKTEKIFYTEEFQLMSSFIYVTDSHLGADPVGYHQQTAYVQRIPEIIDSLGRWLREHRDVAFKYFQIDDRGISMTTISLIGDVEFTAEYDFEKTFVQGRECDRRF